MRPAAEHEDYRAPFGITQIMKLLPHRYPFLLVDHVIELEPGKRVKALKTVSATDFWVPGHFPDNPILPGVLMIEILAQAGGMILKSLPKYQKQFAVLTGAEAVRVRQRVVPGDVLIIEAESIYLKMGASRVKGQITVGETEVMSGEVLFKVLPE